MTDGNVQGFRLSPQQRRLWTTGSTRVDPAAPAWAEAELQGPVDPARLARAAERVVREHEVLRTAFERLASLALPLQVVLPDSPPEFLAEDLAPLDAAGREERCRAVLAELRERPFDLAAGPFVRLRLLRLQGERHRLLLAVPTACADPLGLVHLLAAIHAAAAGEGGPGGGEEGEGPVQYIDLSEWQNELLGAEETAAGREYWRELGSRGIAPLLSLPLEGPPAVSGPAAGPAPPCGELDWTVDEEVREGLGALAGRLGVAVEACWLAAWLALIARLGGRSSLTLAVGFAGRRYPELEAAPGLFARFLPIPFTVDDRHCAGDLAPRVAAALGEAEPWQESFTWELLDAGEGHASVAFSAWDLGGVREAGGLRLAPLRASAGIDRADLALSLVSGPAGPRAELRWDPAIYGQGAIERLRGQLSALLRSILEAPAAPLSQLAALDPGEARRLLVELQRSEEEPALPELPFPHLFRARAALHPDEPAVVAAGRRLTYGELAAQAGRIAAALSERGCGPETVVGLAARRTPELLAGMLGILEAGAAFLALDPALPAGRLAYFLRDSGARALLADGAAAPALADLGLPLLRLDGDFPPAGAHRGGDGGPAILPESLAYVLYTSGSTGEPKGVAVEHRQLVSYLRAVCRRLDLPEGGQYANVSTFAADLGHTMIFPSLALGGCLHLLAEDEVGDPERLGPYFERHGIDCLKIVPSHLAALLAAAPPGVVPLPGKRLVLGGEATRPELLTAIRDRAPGCRICNHYGPTETTVGALAWPLPPGWQPPAGSRGLPLGRPLAGARAYVLLAAPVLAPTGVPGELALGGGGVSRGYLGRPGATAARFLPDPFAPTPGARFYRTGDRARVLPGEGELEFLGRIDEQVKLRGFRVEPREVAAALEAHPRVASAAVVVRRREVGEGEGEGESFLAAYVVPRDGGPLPEAELRRSLAERLPEYMIPAFILEIPALPLTPNGKLDLRALPEPEPPAAAFAPPATAVEEILVGLWEELLGREGIGVEASFFDLGGHSLLATRLIARVRRAFGVEFAMVHLFDAPTVRRMGRIVESLLGTSAAVAPAIVPVSRQEPLPLSYSQQSLWLLDQLEPGKTAYSLPAAIDLEGEVDVPALAATLTAVVARHETLRTRIVPASGRPWQQIDPPARVPLPVVDLGGLPPEARDSLAGRLARREAARPFDLLRGPLLRARLLLRGEGRKTVLLNLHHIISDGWSMGLLIRELVLLYGERTGGARADLPPLPIQFADYAAWQREWLQGDVLARHLDYWKERLRGLPPVLELPSDRPRTLGRPATGALLAVEIPADLTAELAALARREGATLFMVLLAAFKHLLGRTTHREDMVVGAPVANRGDVELENLIGFFVNTLVLRAHLGGAPSFRELLERVREVTLGAYAHQDLPFERLVEELRPERDPGHNPIFQVMLAFQNTPRQPVSPPRVQIHWRGIETGTSKFDLGMVLGEVDGVLRGALDYSRDLFDATTMLRFVDRFRQLLRQVVERPDERLDRLSAMSAAEAHQLLWEWRGIPSTATDPERVDEHFARQAAARPDAIAVVRAEEWLSFAELESRGRRLAAALAARGVGAEVPVAVLMERGLEQIVAVVGIVLAGGVYVPIQPGLPPARVRLFLDEIDPALLVVHRATADSLPESPVPRLYLDATELAALPAAEDSPPPGGPLPSLPVSGDNLCYAIYTSGSTGRPKAVGVTHRGVVRLVRETTFADFGPDQVMMQISTLAFDASTYEIWGSLLNGGRLVLLPEQQVTLDRVRETIARNRITSQVLTTGLFNQMVDFHLPALTSLRQLITGGEALSLPHVRRAAEELSCRLINGYGPTENTTVTCATTLRPAGLAGRASVPIGRPIDGTQVYLGDRRLRPVAIGIPGMLYAAGQGLARGYLGRPARTASSFVPDAMSGGFGERLYATGDLARFLADGRLEFLGRADGQVKVRGFRIELGEIEAALAEHPAVHQAAVLTLDDPAGGKRLVACIVTEATELGAASGSGAGFEALRRHLGERLPDYMVPATFVPVEEIPLSANGKVERRLLAERVALAPVASGQRAEAEEGDSEGDATDWIREVLTGIWSEVLGLPEVDPEVDFFEAGGHSFAATRLVSRAVRAFQVELPLRTLFENPHLGDLARAITEKVRQSQGLAAPSIEPVRGRGEIPASFAQERLWLEEQLEPGQAAFHIRLPLRLRGDLRLALLRGCLDEIVRRHQTLRTTFAQSEGRLVQRVGAPAPVPLPVVDLSRLAPERREIEALSRANLESRRPFDLGAGPLLRTAVLRLGQEDHVLLANMHHIVGDAWSIAVLVREIGALYAASLTGRPSPLPELEVQYGDFAFWQRRWLSEQVLAAQLAAIERRLAGIRPLRLPVRGEASSSDVPSSQRGDRHGIELGPEAVAALRKLGREEGVTLSCLLLSGFSVLLAHLGEQEDIVLTLNAANRSRAETEGLIGFFINQLILRCDLSGDPTFRELLARVWALSLEAYAHQDLPYEKIFQRLRAREPEVEAALSQVKFDFLAGGGPALELPGIDVRQIEIDRPWVHNDLLLQLESSPRGITGIFRYRTDLFERHTVARMGRRFLSICRQVSAEPDRPLSELFAALRAEDLSEQQEREREAGDVLSEGLRRIQPRAARRSGPAAAGPGPSEG